MTPTSFLQPGDSVYRELPPVILHFHSLLSPSGERLVELLPKRRAKLRVTLQQRGGSK